MAGVKGKSGRRRTPAAVKKLNGTFRADRHGDYVEAKTGEPVRPTWLTRGAGEYWDEVVAYLKEVPELLARVDGPALAEFCRAIHVTSTSHDPKQLDKARQEIRHWITKFGMTPQDRAGIRVPQKDKVSADPFAKFLKQNQGDN